MHTSTLIKDGIMKKTLLLLVVVFSSLAMVGCEKNPIKEEEKVYYQNPVFQPVLADPAIIEHEGVYYVYGTQDYGEWGDSFGTRYTPILSSTDLINWTYADSVFTVATRPTWGTPNAGLWAPDIVKIDNQFLLYYSLSTWGDPNPGIGVASASHPLGPWTDHGKLFTSNEIGVNNSIDPGVFEAEGKVYMVWGSFRGIYGIELSADGLSVKNPATMKEDKILLAGLDTSTSWNGATYEGAYVIYKDNYYYMFLSSGTCCDGHNSNYNVRVGRSTTPMGPYIDHDARSMLGTYRGYQVVMSSTRFKGPGHNSIIVDKQGDYYLVYHAFDTNEDPSYGNSPRRSLLIDLLHWDESGWPSVKGQMPSSQEELAPKTN
jgi:arabinan endo-1,5-alpha-L-arabinosidase